MASGLPVKRRAQLNSSCTKREITSASNISYKFRPLTADWMAEQLRVA
jgi:hypothetical protein